MTFSSRTILLAPLALAAGACIGGQAVVYANPPKCNFGPTIPFREPRVLAGYPVKPTYASYEERKAAGATLHQKAPLWSFEVDGLGFPVSASTVIEEGTSNAEQLERVRALFRAMKSEYRLTGQPEPQVVDAGRSTDAPWMGWTPKIIPPPNTHLAFAATSGGAGGKSRATVLSIKAAATALPLPNGAKELTDAELFSRWGGDEAREALISWQATTEDCVNDAGPGGQPCGSAPSALFQCVKLATILERTIIESNEGYRSIVRFKFPCRNHFNCSARATWVVPCTDAVTGEPLPTLCGDLNE